jgi:hypothetical protein
MPFDDKPGDDASASHSFVDNVVPFRAPPSKCGESRDDDELLQRATDMIAKWQATAGMPSMTQVQQLFHELICDGGSAMLRDRVVAAVIAAFDDEMGGKRALASTWREIAKQVATERTLTAREAGIQAENKPLTAEEKIALRDDLWPNVRELAEAPDLMDRVVKQVQLMGVVNEDGLIALIV